MHFSTKRQILDILCLNLSLDGATLVPTMRKPFDLLAEGLISKDTRGDWTPVEPFLAGVAGLEGHIRQALVRLATG